MSTNLPDELRKRVFAAVVAAQDSGLSVVEARKRVAAEHQIGVDEVKDIEREGIEYTWPPLGE